MAPSFLLGKLLTIITCSAHSPSQISARRSISLPRWVSLPNSRGIIPTFTLLGGRVKIEIWAHKIDGLTESDFVLAAKIDRLASVP